MKRDTPLVILIIAGLLAAALITRGNDGRRSDINAQFAEEQLYLGGQTAKRASLAFGGLAADWYWIRSLQYVGRKIVNYEDAHADQLQLNNLTALDFRLLPSLLRMSTTLDPQFMAPYEYGAVMLPTINGKDAIALLNSGIAANPNSWRLYQHLGYIYFQRHEYDKASQVYAAGAKIPGAPPWMFAMSARMKAEGGSRGAAREMYLRLYEASADETVRKMVEKQVMRIDSLDERDLIRRLLADWYARAGHCASTWKDLTPSLRSSRLRIDQRSGAPVDPSGTPYQLINKGCDVGLDPNSPVPHQ
jgi:tetratricopeptide (TPR) repeat protein